jgi:lycopene beta-cyclase
MALAHTQALAARLQLPELLDCVATDWRVTDCFFGGSFDTPFDDKLRLDRAYLQVDRALLKAALQKRHAEGGVQLMQGSVQASTVSPNLFDANLVHDAAGSSLTLSGGEAVRAKLVVDATGFESRMVRREASELWTELTPGYQIAYGMKVDVEGSIAPYAEEAMTLFDYRTDHLQATSRDLPATSRDLPATSPRPLPLTSAPDRPRPPTTSHDLRRPPLIWSPACRRAPTCSTTPRTAPRLCM